MLKDKKELISEATHDFDSLVSIMSILRGENGCPWDMEQTHSSIRKCLIEETYEVVEAIDSDDSALMREELGDLIFQAVFHAEIEKENENFDIYDVVNDICSKMINRHPHVFADTYVSDAEDVSFNWDQLKKAEKHQKSISESLKSIPPYLPALLKAQKVQEKAKKLGFGFESKESALCFAKEHFETSLAESIFALSAAAQFDGIDLEKSLNDTVNHFILACEEKENRNFTEKMQEKSENK